MTNIENLTKETYLAILQNGRYLTLPAKGWSMRPVLKNGDLVVIQYVIVEDAKIGDIIAWKKDGEMNITVHRLIKKVKKNNTWHLITKGDANLSGRCDPAVSVKDVLGRVIKRQRNGREINLDNVFFRIIGYVYAIGQHFCPWVLRVLRGIFRRLRSMWRGGFG